MKPFTTIPQQLVILKERGLMIRDEKMAAKVLNRINYYNLINGYKDYFLAERGENEKFREGVFFEDIHGLYALDYELRNLLLKYILKFETNLKSKISYRFSEAYSEPNAYLELKSFDLNSKNSKFIPELIFTIKKIMNEQGKKKTSIRHYLDNHGHVPIWVLTSYLTFGNVQYFYLSLKPKLKNQIAKDFSMEFAEEYGRQQIKIMPEMLEAIIKVVNYFRNVCAHEERLYNFKVYKKARSASLAKVLNMPADYLNDGNVFTLISILKLVTEKDSYGHLLSELETLFQKYQNEVFSISMAPFLHEMGFPDEWVRLLAK